MERRTLLDLYDKYRHGLMGRREFLARLSLVAGGVMAANSLFWMFEKQQARADLTSKNDPRLSVDDVKFPGFTGEMLGKLARPTGEARHPGVIVIHENKGLNAHIADVTRRVALEGFVALAPDAMSPLGGTPDEEAKATSMINQLKPDETVKNYVAAVKYLKTHRSSTGKVGVVGFCWGGGMANQLAVNTADVQAVVPYYGRPPALEDVPKIKASMLLHYAENDDFANKGREAFEEALKKAGVDYQLYIYPGTQHAFNNDTNPQRYNKAAADLAWKRTIDFFNKKLKT